MRCALLPDFADSVKYVLLSLVDDFKFSFYLLSSRCPFRGFTPIPQQGRCPCTLPKGRTVPLESLYYAFTV